MSQSEARKPSQWSSCLGGKCSRPGRAMRRPCVGDRLWSELFERYACCGSEQLPRTHVIAVLDSVFVASSCIPCMYVSMHMSMKSCYMTRQAFTQLPTAIERGYRNVARSLDLIAATSNSSRPYPSAAPHDSSVTSPAKSTVAPCVWGPLSLAPETAYMCM